MARPNDVTPTGDLVDIDRHGTFMGNRGCLHDDDGVLVRRWRSRAWITCVTAYKGWRAPRPTDPGRYTVLFFDDEAVALAAGHRPCALCRRSDYVAFLDAWAAAFGTRPTAVELDRVLHADRLDGGVQRRHRRPWRDLPDAAFVDLDGMPAVVRGDRLVPWSAGAGYGAPRRRPLAGDADVLTPACTIEVLGAGYRCARGTRSPAPPATSAG